MRKDRIVLPPKDRLERSVATRSVSHLFPRNQLVRMTRESIAILPLNRIRYRTPNPAPTRFILLLL